MGVKYCNVQNTIKIQRDIQTISKLLSYLSGNPKNTRVVWPPPKGVGGKDTRRLCLYPFYDQHNTITSQSFEYLDLSRFAVSNENIVLSFNKIDTCKQTKQLCLLRPAVAIKQKTKLFNKVNIKKNFINS